MHSSGRSINNEGSNLQANSSVVRSLRTALQALLNNPLLSSGLPFSAAAIGTAVVAMADPDAHSVIKSYGLTVLCFKLAYAVPSIKALWDELRKTPNEKSYRIMLQSAFEVLALCLAAVCAVKFVEQPSFPIIATAFALASLAWSVPFLARLDRIAVTVLAGLTFAAGMKASTSSSMSNNFFSTDIAGGLLSLGFAGFDVRAAFSRKVMSVALVLDMVASSVLQFALPAIKEPTDNIFLGCALGLLGLGSALLLFKLIGLNSNSVPNLEEKRPLLVSQKQPPSIATCFNRLTACIPSKEGSQLTV